MTTLGHSHTPLDTQTRLRNIELYAFSQLPPGPAYDRAKAELHAIMRRAATADPNDCRTVDEFFADFDAGHCA